MHSAIHNNVVVSIYKLAVHF